MLSFDVVFVVVTETIIRLNPMTTQVIPTKAIAKRFMMLRLQNWIVAIKNAIGTPESANIAVIPVARIRTPCGQSCRT